MTPICFLVTRHFLIDLPSQSSLTRRMKIILASLMCLVLGASECFAIKGGPVYGGSGSLVGTYAGVLQPGDAVFNSLGIFTISVPQSGLASGVFIIFQEGLLLSGSMQAVADGTTKKITGLLHAEATRAEIIDGTVNIRIVGIADGQMIVNVSSNVSSTSGRRLSGTAVVDVHDQPAPRPDTHQTYQISGFQQSATPPSG